jgi:hypothetical protein
MNIEKHYNLEYGVGTLDAETAILDIISQCRYASNEELEEARGLINQIYDMQWDRWQAFTPEANRSTTEFVREFWDANNVFRFEICSDLISLNNLRSLAYLLENSLRNNHDFTPSYIANVVLNLNSRETLIESIFNRFNTVIFISKDFLNNEDMKEILITRDSMKLKSGNWTLSDPRLDILERLPSMLGSHWSSGIRIAWLKELEADYKTLFSSQV